MRQFIDQNRRVQQNLKSMHASKLSTANKEEISKIARKIASEGLAPATIAKFVTTLHNGITKCAPKNFDLQNATPEELRDFIINVQQSDYSIKTQSEIKKSIKKYYKANGKDSLVNFFTSNIPKSKRKVPAESDMLTQKEIDAMISACKNNRDKAFISLLGESGMRISEIGSLKLKHVSFDQHGAIVTIPEGKTGARRIRVVQCERHLRQWIMDHPFAADKEAWLWVNLNSSPKSELHDRMDYMAMRMVIVKKAIDAGVKTHPNKKGTITTLVHPHLFRHSAATRLAKHMTEQQLKIYLGWTAGSDMASIYVHLSGKDVDNAILQMNGIKSVESHAESVRCQACGRNNPAEALVCNNCFRPLSIKAALVNENREAQASKVLEALMTGELSVEEIKNFARKKNPVTFK